MELFKINQFGGSSNVFAGVFKFPSNASWVGKSVFSSYKIAVNSAVISVMPYAAKINK